MNRPTIKITKPDGSTKIIVGKSSDNQYVKTATEPVKSREPIKEKKPKPIMGRAGLTSTKTAYKYGGKLYVRKREL